MTDGARHAFSLIEAIVVIVVMSVVGVVTFRYVAFAAEAYARLSALHEADTEVFNMSDRMRREVRPLRNTLTADISEYAFVNRNDATNTFRLAGRTVTMNGYPLAEDVTLFEMQYYDVTNGLLTPLPLNATNLDRIAWFMARVKVEKRGQASVLDARVFYPRSGTVK